MKSKCLLHPKLSFVTSYGEYGLCAQCREVACGAIGTEAAASIMKKINRTLTKRKTEMKVEFVLNEPATNPPSRAHEFDAGNDLHACEDAWIAPQSTTKVKTGVCIKLHKNTVGLIKDRSSLGSKGIHVFAGVIDHGYTGPISVILYNSNKFERYEIKKGDRIAQLLVMPVYNVEWEQTSHLEETDRGAGAFGSTGK